MEGGDGGAGLLRKKEWLDERVRVVVVWGGGKVIVCIL